MSTFITKSGALYQHHVFCTSCELKSVSHGLVDRAAYKTFMHVPAKVLKTCSSRFTPVGGANPDSILHSATAVVHMLTVSELFTLLDTTVVRMSIAVHPTRHCGVNVDSITSLHMWQNYAVRRWYDHTVLLR